MSEQRAPLVLADPVEPTWSQQRVGSPWGTPDDVPVALVALDENGNIAEFNAAAAELFDDGGSQRLLRVGSPFLALVGRSVRTYLAWSRDPDMSHARIELRSGARRIPVEVAKRVPQDRDGLVVISIVTDARTRVTDAQRVAFDHSRVGIFVFDDHRIVQAANTAVIEMTGIEREDWIGANWQRVLLGGLPSEFIDEMNSELGDVGKWSGHIVVPQPDGGDRVLDVQLEANDESLSTDSDGSAQTVIAYVTDVTEGSSVEKALRELARSDQLTGLLNRAGFLEQLEQRFAEAQRNGSGLTLLYIDLDHFKTLNDQYGHRYGDLLLEAFAKRLRTSLKSSDIIGRVGGDEFTVLFDPGLSDATLDNVVSKLKSRLLTEYRLDEASFSCTASLGSAGYPWDAQTADELLEFADHAMYQAKTRGRNSHTRFDRDAFRDWSEQEDLVKAIENGIDNMHFVPYYQPVFNTTTGEIHSVEALARWISPDQPDVIRLPGYFLPMIEGTTAGVRLGLRMLDQVFVHMRSFAETVGEVSVAVNLSAGQLRAEAVVAHIESLAKAYPSEILRLSIELVESAFYDGDPVIAENLQRIVNVGATLSLDDFGTGHSSMLSLRAHQFTQLKIDRQFLWAASTQSPADITVLESMIELGQKLDMQIVAEGVETEAQHRYLSELGCELAQGFHLARPMPKEQLRTLLASQPPAG